MEPMMTPYKFAEALVIAMRAAGNSDTETVGELLSLIQGLSCSTLRLLEENVRLRKTVRFLERDLLAGESG